MHKKDLKLSIIVPTYNEQRTIKELIQYVRQVAYPIDYEIIIVDDASVRRAKQEDMADFFKEATASGKIKIFQNPNNRGKGFSIRKGIEESEGDIIIVQDADNEYDPHDIPKLLEPILNYQAHVVYGSRFLKCRWPKGMATANWLANRFLTRLTNILFGLNLTDMETCYKVFRADLIKGLPLKTNRFTFEPEVTALLVKRGIAIVELPINYQGRTAKEGKKIKAKDFLFAVGVLLWQRIKRN